MWLTPAGSTTPPALRSKRYSPALRPAQHYLSASAMQCSSGLLPTTPERPLGRAVAAAPRQSPLRGMSTPRCRLVNISAGLPAARNPRSFAGAPAPLLAACASSVPNGPASLVGPCGPCPPYGRANRGLRPAASAPLRPDICQSPTGVFRRYRAQRCGSPCAPIPSATFPRVR